MVHPDLSSEAIAGKLFVDRARLMFRAEGIEREIPLEQLEIKLGHGGDAPVSFHDRRQPGLSIFTEDDSIFECADFMRSQHVRSQLEAIFGRKELMRRLRITVYCLAACAFIAWMGWVATGAMVRSLAANVPPDWERTFGADQIRELQSRMVFVNDSNEVARLNMLAAPLIKAVPAGEVRFQFHVVQSEYPNAFALPGGHVVVTTALLKLADRPDELLGVVAHEMAHVTQHHFARKIISAAGPVMIFGIFLHSRDQTLDVLSSGSGLLVTQGFSQEYELEADDFGWKYLVAANIDPRGMIDMFKKLKAFDARFKGMGFLPQAFNSHPALDVRIARLERRWRKLPNKTDFLQLPALDWKQP